MLSKKCTQNTLTSHLLTLYPIESYLCKKLETESLVRNKEHMCNILKRVVRTIFSTAEVTETTFRKWKSGAKIAEVGAPQLRTIAFEEITDVLLLNDRKLFYHAKISIDFNLS